ncbi:MAG TPA: hypothetical protein VF641_02645 [Methylobacterium sp.]
MPVLPPRLAFAILLGLAIAPVAALAEPAAPRAKATTAAGKAPDTAWTSAEPAQACSRSRRKLWQDGEGWVVKTITLCP